MIFCNPCSRFSLFSLIVCIIDSSIAVVFAPLVLFDPLLIFLISSREYCAVWSEAEDPQMRGVAAGNEKCYILVFSRI